jgi:hypothetical protein
MQQFLAVAMSPAAQAEREEVELFGNRKQTVQFRAFSDLLRRADVLKLSSYDDDPFTMRWKAEERAGLGDWLAGVITGNRADELEKLAKVLRAKRHPRKQTLKSLILECLTRSLRDAGLNSIGFSVTSVLTRYVFRTMQEAQDRRDYRVHAEKLAAWWTGKDGPHLLPRHLPTKKRLKEMVEAEFKTKVPQDFAKEFRDACKALGLQGLPDARNQGGIDKPPDPLTL